MMPQAVVTAQRSAVRCNDELGRSPPPDFVEEELEVDSSIRVDLDACTEPEREAPRYLVRLRCQDVAGAFMVVVAGVPVSAEKPVDRGFYWAPADDF